MFMLDQPVGFVGERKAVSLLCLAFYLAFFSLMALLLANVPPDQPELRAWWACFAALGACYGLSFFSVAAEWFWARWFAIGLGYSGLTMAGWGILMARTLDPTLVFYGITHGLVALCLQGEKMAAVYDAKPGWRERLKLDEAAAVRVRHTVTRTAASLPTLIMLALAPRQESLALLPLALAGAGLYGVLRLRTWGLLVLGLAGATTLGISTQLLATPCGGGDVPVEAALGCLGGALLLLALSPFLRPMLRFVRAA